jgi:hypothetical protein
VRRGGAAGALARRRRLPAEQEHERDDALAASVLAALRPRAGAAGCDAQLALCHACALGYERAAGSLMELLGPSAGMDGSCASASASMDAVHVAVLREDRLLQPRARGGLEALPRLEAAYRALLLAVVGADRVALRGVRAARWQGPARARVVARLLDWERALEPEHELGLERASHSALFAACAARNAGAVRAMLTLRPSGGMPGSRARRLRLALAAPSCARCWPPARGTRRPWPTTARS